MPTEKKKTPAKPKPKTTPKPKAVMYRSTKISLYHPYQGVRLEINTPTACTEDSWLTSQIKAGLIVKC